MSRALADNHGAADIVVQRLLARRKRRNEKAEHQNEARNQLADDVAQQGAPYRYPLASTRMDHLQTEHLLAKARLPP